MNKIEFELHERQYYYEPPSCIQLRAALKYAHFHERFGAWAVLAGIDKGTLVDVGANIGYYTSMLATMCPEAKVIAIEPVEENIRYIRANCSGNIKLLKCAAHDKCEDVWLSMPSREQRPDMAEKYTAGNTGLMSIYGQGDATCKAPGFPLDVLLKDESDIKFIKIDAEGHEFAVLRGARNAILEHRPILAVEFRGTNERMAGVDGDDIRKYITNMGYVCFGATMEDELYIPEENTKAWDACSAFVENENVQS